MSDLTLGGSDIIVENPAVPVFEIEAPVGAAEIVVPVAGPAGRDGLAGAASDASVAAAIATPGSQTQGALIPVIDERIEFDSDPGIDLLLYFDNALI